MAFSKAGVDFGQAAPAVVVAVVIQIESPEVIRAAVPLKLPSGLIVVSFRRGLAALRLVGFRYQSTARLCVMC